MKFPKFTKDNVVAWVVKKSQNGQTSWNNFVEAIKASFGSLFGEPIEELM